VVVLVLVVCKMESKSSGVGGCEYSKSDTIMCTKIIIRRRNPVKNMTSENSDEIKRLRKTRTQGGAAAASSLFSSVN
jgi:hypothetical protein